MQGSEPEVSLLLLLGPRCWVEAIKQSGEFPGRLSDLAGLLPNLCSPHPPTATGAQGLSHPEDTGQRAVGPRVSLWTLFEVYISKLVLP